LADDCLADSVRLRELAAARIPYGYRRLHILLRREGWKVSHKRTYRIYRDEGLSIRPKLPNRKRAWRYRQGRLAIGEPNEIWAMDFMSDRLFDGRPVRILTVVDCHTRESLSLTPKANFRAYQVTEGPGRPGPTAGSGPRACGSITGQSSLGACLTSERT
jgi:putative transposase